MKRELMVSVDEKIYIINATWRKNGHVRAGALLCDMAKDREATFLLDGWELRLLVPVECIDRTTTTKTFNIDLPILNPDDQILFPPPR